MELGTFSRLSRKERITWFASHSDVDPEVEIDKILRVSGSPYEHDNGSRLNDEKTAAEAVLVINRYEWGYYDKRGKNEIGVDDEAEIATRCWRPKAVLA